jgi:CDP-diacylglycerol pyrophosphatase
MTEENQFFALRAGAALSALSVTVAITMPLILTGLGNAQKCPPPSKDPDILWKIVQQCIRNQRQFNNPPIPCITVNLTEAERAGWEEQPTKSGDVLLKDAHGLSQLLLLPTGKVSGIEDKSLSDMEATNYFGDAWRDRKYLQELAAHPLKSDEVVLAVNPRLLANGCPGRSQNQLHIHIDCANPDARNQLENTKALIKNRWSQKRITILDHEYYARRLMGEELTENPFRLLKEVPAVQDGDMGRWTLAVVGEVFEDGPGFIILAGTDSEAEDLQEHSACMKGN